MKPRSSSSEAAFRGDPAAARAAPTYYQVLGVDSAAEGFLIEAAYRAMMRRLHPDKGGDTHRAQLINEAFSVLRDDAARARYDKILALAESVAPPPSLSLLNAAAARPPRAGRLASGIYLALGMVLVVSALASLRQGLQAVAETLLATPAAQQGVGELGERRPGAVLRKPQP